MYDRVSPCTYTGLAQMFLEPILRSQAELLAQKGTQINFNCGIKGFKEKDGEVVSVELENGKVVKAKYILCCDGGKFCAEALGIDLIGPR